ncbi:hypothetical protein [Ferrovum sp.]|uniref:hypothetical protein n=1 Tax=Ferrovum sp. TaxID=2609467 RepID=UPI0026194601|nr:hypothetical protein [Ferrovum sp.]
MFKFKFIKSLLHGKPSVNTPPMPAVELMSFQDILEYVTQLPELMTIPQGTAITKRLYEIALYDNHVAKEDRTNALQLLETVKSSMESVMSPESIDAYRKANAHMEGGVCRLGIGSLVWLINEHQISHEEIVPFIARPEHSQLREDFFTVLSPANNAEIKVQLELYLRTQGT